MSNIKTLYAFELKKIMKRKITVAGTAILLLTVIFMPLINIIAPNQYPEYFSSSYDKLQHQKQYDEAISGRKIDDTLLNEMASSYSSDSTITGNEDAPFVRPYNNLYSLVLEIYNYAPRSEGELTADDLYSTRESRIRSSLESSYLSKGEQEYWLEKESHVQKPFTYEPYLAMEDTGYMLYSLNVLMLFICAMVLAGVFSDEISRKTDALIMCSQNGRRPLYIAKILAGLTFCFALSCICGAIIILMNTALYGTSGFSAQIQLSFWDYSYPMTMGQFVLLEWALLILANLLSAGIVMLLSIVLKNGVATMSVIAGAIIIGMCVTIPEQYELLSRIWTYNTVNLPSVWGTGSTELVGFGGKYLTVWQFGPIIYAVITAALLWLGFTIYIRYEVKSR